MTIDAPEMGSRRTLIRRPCITCGAPTAGRSYCDRHALEAEAARDAQEWWREAYRSPEYHAARKVVLERASGRCERLVGRRCTAPAREMNHIVPLSAARSMDEALALCAPENLEGVCPAHNPRGGWNRA